MKGDEANFPIELKSPFVNFLQKIILWSLKVLAFFMVLVILWSVVDVVILISLKAKDSHFFITDMDEVLSMFGAFMIVLIAIEIFLNIALYLKKDIGHLKLVIATALMAVARKVIILDYDKVEYAHMYGMGALILALGITYWFIGQAATPNVQTIYLSDDAPNKS